MINADHEENLRKCYEASSEKEDGWSFFLYKTWTEKLPYCMCGNPDLVLKFLANFLVLIEKRRDILLDDDFNENLHHWEQSVEFLFKENFSALFFLVTYWLNDADLLEHGTSVPGWLTEDGKQFIKDVKEIKND